MDRNCAGYILGLCSWYICIRLGGIMENQMENSMGNAMEIGITWAMLLSGESKQDIPYGT